jgi:hypothetical protein
MGLIHPNDAGLKNISHAFCCLQTFASHHPAFVLVGAVVGVGAIDVGL